MENTNEQVLTNTAEDLNSPIMPIGWDESVDIFDDAWLNSGDKSDGASETKEEEASDSSVGADEPSANGQEDAKADEPKADNIDQPATQEDGGQPKKIRFKTKVNHKEVDAEIDESEIPELYQQAQGLKSARNKLDAMTATYEKMEQVRELLGYNTLDEMLDASEKAYVESEVGKLVDERVHEEVAKDIVSRKVNDIKEKALKGKKVNSVEEDNEPAPEAEKPKTTGSKYKEQVTQLLTIHPELKGKTIDQAVINECVNSGRPLAVVYEQYLNKQVKAENEQLRKKTQTLEQNAEAAKRAPVRSATSGGATDTSPDDPFLAGFNRNRY